MASPVVAAGMLGSRQKNCNSCVQTKRRCDRRAPVCSRCAERKVPCVYGKARVPHHTEQMHQQTRASPDTQELQFTSPDLSLFDSVGHFNAGCIDSLPIDPLSRGPDTPGPASQTVPNAFVSGDVPMDNFMDFFDNQNTSSPDRWLVPVDPNLAIERPGTPADEEITNSYQKMASFCVSPVSI